MTGRVFHVGSEPAVRAALQAAFERDVDAGPVADLRGGDVVCMEAFADVSQRADLPGRNVWSACRVFKERQGVVVHLVVRGDDRTGAQLGRFVLADGVLTLQPSGQVDGVEQLRNREHGRQGRSIDALLARYGKAFDSAARNSKALARLLEWERSNSCLARLQDEETGLFDASYVVMKLDEEYRRAMRFHHPLSLVLLDIGGDVAAMASGPERRQLLAEVAAVFLNECRDIDVLGRFTATTFLFLLPGTPPDGATALSQRMLRSLVRLRLPARIDPVAGAAAVPDSGIADRKAFLLVAETCLERARSTAGVGSLVTSWE